MQLARAQVLGRGVLSSGQWVANMQRVLDHPAEEVSEPDRERAPFMLVRGMRIVLETLLEKRPDLLRAPAGADRARNDRFGCR